MWLKTKSLRSFKGGYLTATESITFLTIPAGTVLKSGDDRVQAMLVARIQGERVPNDPARYRRSSEIVLSDSAPHSSILEVYCLDFEKANPRPNQQFDIVASDPSAGHLVSRGLQNGLTARVIQSALWIGRANPSEADLRGRFQVSEPAPVW